MSMLSAYNEHKAKVETIRTYITTLKEIASVSLQHPEEYSAKALLEFVSMPQKRSYDYSLIIITMYGVLESFIEEVLSAYLFSLCDKIKHYSNLPETLVKNHLDLSAKLIGNTSIKYGSITKENIISNLHSCLNQSKEAYKLNIEAFTQHTANFRIDTIQECFKMVGVENIRDSIKKSSPIINFLIQDYSREEIGTLPDSKYFEILEELVQRRNVIAHGSKIDDLLSLDILDQYCSYIISLMESIYLSLLEKYYEIMVSKNIAQKIGSSIKVIDNRIVCINSSNINIKIGQVLIGKNGKDVFSWGKIESIQLDGKDINEVEADKAVDIGMAVSFKAKDNFTYYLF